LEEEEEASSVKIEEDDTLDKATESHIVIAALKAMVIFATAFTLPGGNRNEECPN